jgi:hypothetical protein
MVAGDVVKAIRKRFAEELIKWGWDERMDRGVAY